MSFSLYKRLFHPSAMLLETTEILLKWNLCVVFLYTQSEALFTPLEPCNTHGTQRHSGH